MYELPFEVELNKIEILKQLNLANNKVGELNGMLNVIPNSNLILNLISLKESKNSSTIDNINTTYDEIYKEFICDTPKDSKVREILNYNKAIYEGVNLIKQQGFISTNDIIKIHQIAESNNSGIRQLPCSFITDAVTGEIFHKPPQRENEIRDLMHNLELFINQNEDYDPLIQMALINYQFESIHPFYDGNGRTGRILNMLYLILQEKINEPIVYLSKYIKENKNEYYRLIQNCNKDINNLKDFVLYILKGIEHSSIYMIDLIFKINNLINTTVKEMQERLPNIYKFKIVEHLFSYVYTKNELFRNDLNISRTTATKYLKLLESEGFLVSERIGKEIIYKHTSLFNLINS